MSVINFPYTSCNFDNISAESMKSKLALEELLFDKLESNSHLLSLAETPICEQFINDPVVSQLMLDCILDGIENSNQKIQFECQELLKDYEARNFFFRQTASKLYLSFSKKLMGD